MEHRLSSIQWKITRSFIVASLVSTVLLTFLLFLLWFVIHTFGLESHWYAQWLGITEHEDGFILRLLFIAFFGLIATVVGGAVIGFYNGRKIKRSLQSLSWAAENLTLGQLHYRITVNGDDEISELAEQFNHMAVRLEEQVESLQRLVRENAELHQKARKLAIDEERQRLARDLHDSISQQLFAIMMTTAACARMIDKDVDKAKKQFAIIEQIASQAQAEMRALLLHLRPIQLEGKQIADALRELLSELSSKHPIEYVWDIDEVEELPIGFDEHLFRIAQECLSNALRHSRATQIMLSLKLRNTMLVMRITDNGQGFDPKTARSQSSMGLLNIAERTGEIGGIWELNSVEGKGTTIEIRVPLILKGGEEDE